jgi:hypothetical protein
MSGAALEKVSSNKAFGGDLVKYKFKVGWDPSSVALRDRSRRLVSLRLWVV